MKSIIVLASITILMFSHCYYDSAENLYPELPGDCDTSNVSFELTIRPLLSANCWACHSDATAAAFGNNLALENYTDVINLQSAVLGAISHQPPFSPMPKNGSKLNSCLIRQFEIWIETGSPQK